MADIEIIRGWKNLPERLRGAAVALGNFDGVHLGHQRVIGEAVAAAAALGVPAGVISFDPHPRRWFQPEAEPFRVASVGQDARAMSALGVERLYLIPFDAELAEMTDEAFAQRVLAEGLGARHVAAGFDITFGKGRTGSPDLLREYGRRFGFTASVTPPVQAGPGGDKLSSSAVREALKAGDPARAAEILGRPFAIEGEVIHGDKRGRELGYPTANIALDDYVRPRFGIYAARMRLPDGRVLDGVASLGVRPMFETPEPLLEVWLFDFDGDLYGQVVEVELIAFLRPEAKFADLDTLKDQIARDAVQARRVLQG
ncbi:bifunctional riboflavin kinase/FAD synthetase [Brevundimonas sp. 2R-24]|uniref:Riboflavin biosynthesis protein n=1 Tax=Peiella sedimenti TaxID=3061083 RepID=A0ABT8SHE3_9CAUL|nr:bifunctional riboflavin kinase/FAD synthetase [Caulobacteraceae bacterium XZ-24]